MELLAQRYIDPEKIREPYLGRWTGALGIRKVLIVPEGITVMVHKAG
jgi:hypothetical protein